MKAGLLLLVMAAVGVAQNKTYHGVLLDAKCAVSAGVDTPLTRSALSPEKAAAEQDRTSTPAEIPAEAQRKSKEDITPCQATLTSLTFALRTHDGRVLKFDQKGNDRVVLLLQKEPEWKEALNSVAGQTNAAEHASPRKVAVVGKREADLLRLESIRLDK